VKIEFDPVKRHETLVERGLDFQDAPIVFDGVFKTDADLRFDYQEERFITYGWLDGQAVAIVWTDRADTRRIISMRRMHNEEIENVGLDRP
jgi:uncharacterized protein